MKMSTIKSNCPQCNGKIDLDSNFCINCGFSVKNYDNNRKKVTIENRFASNLISEHLQQPSERNLQIIATLEVVMGSIFFFGALVISSISYFVNIAFESNKELLTIQKEFFGIFESIFPNFEFFAFIILFASFLYGALCIIFGLGLFYMKKWGKFGTIVISGIGMLYFPIGTLIGGLLIYYLTRKEINSVLT
ncbi:MAG: hypothetical protein HeimC3_04740 [Candidatus Heimdallarchaeota archaeon LC_3]|nr:MAG: hypothetical protein HeimC3_04740 [Candidatus Heimdallarchaeota archaeon LC_3]